MGSLIVNYNADSLNLKRNPIFIHSLRSITIILYDMIFTENSFQKKNQTNKQSKGKNNTHIHHKSILLVETTDKVSTD